MPYRAIAPPPRDATAAMALIRSVIDENVGRLQELLAAHEAIATAEAAERHDRAALDCSREFERHRRYQSARTRELLRTLETLRKMRKEEFRTENGEEVTAADGYRTAEDREQIAADGCEVRAGWCGDGQSGEPMTDGDIGPVVGLDSNLVIDDATNDKIGILSHEGTDPAGQPEQGDGVEQCLSESATTAQKCQTNPIWNVKLRPTRFPWDNWSFRQW